MADVTNLSERRPAPPGRLPRQCGTCGGQWFTITGQVTLSADDTRITGWVVRIPGAEPFTASGKARPATHLTCGDCGATEPLGGQGWPLD